MATIYDAVIRQQLFLERLKAGKVAESQAAITNIFNEFKSLLSLITVDNLGELSKKQLNDFISRFTAVARTLYGRYSLEFLKFLEALTKSEVGLSSLIVKEVGEDLTRNVPLREFGRDYRDRVWAQIRASVIPATGESFIPFIDALGVAAITTLVQRFKLSAINNETVKDLLEQINGVQGKTRQKGGILAQLLNKAGAMVATATQQVVSFVNDKIHGAFYDQYIWISIIDERTSGICRSRNMQIYEYGKGPLTPAHIRCRSRTAPYTDREQKRETSFSDWLTKQPPELRTRLQDESAISLAQYGNLAAVITQ